MRLIRETIQLPALYTVPAESEELRNEIALRGLEITTITTVEQNNEAAQIVRDMRRHVKGVEASRQTLTKPLLDGQRLLKALADDHVGPLADGIKRLEKLGTIYNEAEERRVALLEQVRREEIARLEQQRIEAEAMARAANSVSDIQAGAELVEQTLTAVDAVIVAPLPEVNKASGQSTRQVLRYEVLDIRAIYAARPELCNLEIKPSAVNATCVPEMPVPGLRLWWETKTTWANR